jgi:carbonic anhydrase
MVQVCQDSNFQDQNLLVPMLMLDPDRDLSMLHAANETYILDHDKSMVEEERNRHLTELFTLAEAEWLKKQSIVIKAMQERDLKVHAFVFDKKANMCVRLVE